MTLTCRITTRFDAGTIAQLDQVAAWMKRDPKVRVIGVKRSDAQRYLLARGLAAVQAEMAEEERAKEESRLDAQRKEEAAADFRRRERERQIAAEAEERRKEVDRRTAAERDALVRAALPERTPRGRPSAETIQRMNESAAKARAERLDGPVIDGNRLSINERQVLGALLKEQLTHKQLTRETGLSYQRVQAVLLTLKRRRTIVKGEKSGMPGNGHYYRPVTTLAVSLKVEDVLPGASEHEGASDAGRTGSPGSPSSPRPVRLSEQLRVRPRGGSGRHAAASGAQGRDEVDE